MNKQEAIEKIEGSLMYEITRHIGKAVNIYDVIDIVKQIDEPEKPVVPQYVADFYESIKGDFEDKVYALCVQFFDESELNSDVALWFGHSKNKPIETLVMMHKFGYEIEKLYTVELPIYNGPLGFHYVLRKNKEGEIVIGSFYNKYWRNFDYCQLTEAEIKKDHDWAWKYAKEV